MLTNMHEAKSKLSQLVDAAINGDDVIIAKSGTPVVRLVQFKSNKPRIFGQFKGELARELISCSIGWAIASIS